MCILIKLQPCQPAAGDGQNGDTAHTYKTSPFIKKPHPRQFGFCNEIAQYALSMLVMFWTTIDPLKRYFWMS